MIKKKSQVQEKATFFSTSQKSEKKKSKNFFNPQNGLKMIKKWFSEGQKIFSIFFFLDFWDVEKKAAFSWTWDFFLIIIYIEKWQKSPQNVWPHKKCGKNRKNFLTLKIEKKWFKNDFEAKKKKKKSDWSELGLISETYFVAQIDPKCKLFLQKSPRHLEIYGHIKNRQKSEKKIDPQKS